MAWHKLLYLFALVLLVVAPVSRAGNCCAPAVAQHGVVGETVTLPNVLKVGLHYEFLRAEGLFDGSASSHDPADTREDWRRLIFSAEYGVLRRLSVAVQLPWVWKEKTTVSLDNSSDGLGDMVFSLRYSPIARDFVDWREVSVGVGVKMPTGTTDRTNYSTTLPEELQPGTGSWDYHLSAAYYQGWELADLLASGTYVLTTSHEGYEFGNQFSWSLIGAWHLVERADMVTGLVASHRAMDIEAGESVQSTGRDQAWLRLGGQVQVIPGLAMIQGYFDIPVYQKFNGRQIGSDFNVLVGMAWSIPLGSGDE